MSYHLPSTLLMCILSKCYLFYKPSLLIMKYNIRTFTSLNQPLYVAELMSPCYEDISYLNFLSPEELIMLSRRKNKNKKSEFIFSRYLIKHVLKISQKEAKLSTIKYCKHLNLSGIFQQDKLVQRLSLSHSNQYVAFSFCAIEESLGVDIEVVTKRNIKPLINEFFCAEDKELIYTNSNPTQKFYQLWTEKEAVTKKVNASIFTLLNHPSTQLKKKFQLESIICDDFVVSVATHIGH